MSESEIIVGDCRESMAGMPERSVQCVVTSPPYWGLRDYGTAEWEGGDGGCDHKIGSYRGDEGEKTWDGGACFGGDKFARDTCPKCGAKRVDRQLGLESTPDEYLAGMLDVFRAVRRVLRDDGTVWCNMGDGYNSAASNQNGLGLDGKVRGGNASRGRQTSTFTGLKPKDLIGMPWRLAFALQADGWYLRSDIIWAKPNPMPESVTDRPTKSHEHMFLLTKRARYFYDADAVRERAEYGRRDGGFRGEGSYINNRSFDNSSEHAANTVSGGDGSGRNLRDVWTIPTEAYAEAHFATFPRRLVEPCIKAGTSDKGRCPECGAPWRRVVEKDESLAEQRRGDQDYQSGGLERGSTFASATPGVCTETTTVGWEPGCGCFDGIDTSLADRSPVPCLVLDPFAGSGTTGVVAKQLGRSFIGCELNPEYAEMARRRIANPERIPAAVDAPGQIGLFEEAIA